MRSSASRLRPSGTLNSRAFLARKSGFTLIELLVVVAIIAISFGVFMTLNFSFGNPQDALKQEGLKLQQLMKFALEQAVIRSDNYGLRINESQYRFMKLIEQPETGVREWKDMDDRILKPHPLPDNMSFELILEGIEATLEEEDESEEPENKIVPQVFIMSSEELTPDFRLQIRLAGYDDVYELHGNPAGRFELKNLNEEF